MNSVKQIRNHKRILEATVRDAVRIFTEATKLEVFNVRIIHDTDGRSYPLRVCANVACPIDGSFYPGLECN